MLRYKVILNPAAGRGTARAQLPFVRQALEGYGLSIDVAETARPGHALDLARQAVADNFDVIVAGGGDGTVNETINGMMQAKQQGMGRAALAVIPLGRGNDFAASMGVGADWQRACLAVGENHRRWIDIGRSVGEFYPDGRYFGNGVGIGFDAVVGFQAAKMAHISDSSYVVAAIKTIFLYFKAPEVQLVVDGQTSTLPCLMINIMNGRRLGGKFWMTPNAKPDDGIMDLCIARQVSRLEILKIMPLYQSGTQHTHPAIRTMHGKRVTITALKGTLPAHADGETLCTEGHHLEIEILPHQLELIIPQDA